MNLAWQYRKLYLLAFGLLAAFSSLAYRLVDLQAVRHDELEGLAVTNTVRTIARQPVRGQILDIRGNPLATSLPAKTVCADPTLLGDQREAVARALAPLLQTNEEYLVERLTPRLMVADGKTNISKYVVLKHKVSMETWEKIKLTMATLPLGVDESKLKRQDQSFLPRRSMTRLFLPPMIRSASIPAAALPPMSSAMSAAKVRTRAAATASSWNSTPT